MHITFKLPITPPTNRYNGISGWTGQSSKNFIPEQQKLIIFVILSDQTVQQAVQCKLKFCTEVQFLDPRYVPSVCWSGSWIKWGLHLPLQEWGLWASKGQEGSKSNYLTTLASILTSDKWTTDWAGQEVFIRSRKKSLKISTIYKFFFLFHLITYSQASPISTMFVACSWVRFLKAWVPVLVGAPGTISVSQAANRERGMLKFLGCLVAGE